MDGVALRVLVACEFSGAVRDAFIAKGHDALSVDLLPSETPGPHIQGDVFTVLAQPWDLVIAFPPCTHLCSSGARWWKEKAWVQNEAIGFVQALWACQAPKMAVENPVGVLSTVWRKPDQIIQPWQFGHGEVKTTCLWTRGLPKLVPTDIVDGRVSRILALSPSPGRAKERSRTYAGIAAAMAEQWG